MARYAAVRSSRGGICLSALRKFHNAAALITVTGALGKLCVSAIQLYILFGIALVRRKAAPYAPKLVI